MFQRLCLPKGGAGVRRVISLIAVLLLLALPASAFSGLTAAQNQTTVNSDGSCAVTLTVTLQLDAMPASLVFPVPLKATGITVNGSAVSGVFAGSVRNIDLSGFVSGPGTYSLVIRYNLEGAVSGSGDDLTLTLELLSGFGYPVDTLSFSVTLPGTVEGKPAFSSTYYQDSIELMMDVTREGSTVSGTVKQRLQDHEKLTMTLPVTAEMFPQAEKAGWSIDTPDLIIFVLFAAAALYWLTKLRGLPGKRVRRTTPPDGITAGEIGCRLTGQGADLTMMVVSWAQMGYILIQPDDNGRVLLHKRMDMGNERDDFENRIFQKLFGKRSVVDGTGYHYAQVCRKASRTAHGYRSQLLPTSGNPLLFRLLAAAAGAVSGVVLAAAFANATGWQVVLGMILVPLGAAAAWLMQGAAASIHGRKKLPALLGLAAAALWLGLGFAAGEWQMLLFVTALELLTGPAALYGGRRNDHGKQTTAEILGLRHYLKTIPPEEMKRNLKIDPQYFYDLAPYALALGVDRQFARQLQKARLPQCPYLTTGMDGHLTAREWMQLLRTTVTALDAMQQRLPLDKLLGR